MDAFDMGRALFAARHPFRLIIFEGGDHGLTEYHREVHRAVVDWLNHHVRDRAPLPNLEPHGRSAADSFPVVQWDLGAVVQGEASAG